MQRGIHLANKKKERALKVASQPGYYLSNDQRPAITLQGKWLKELGFEIGDHVSVKCQNNKLIITKAKEITV